jgi:hypothetical protein
VLARASHLPALGPHVAQISLVEESDLERAIESFDLPIVHARSKDDSEGAR